jgi:hypothetical protein
MYAVVEQVGITEVIYWYTVEFKVQGKTT